MTGTGRRCKSCEARLPELARPDRIYCSPSCRQAAYQRRRAPSWQESARWLEAAFPESWGRESALKSALQR